jgi:hypothetical protein
MIEPLGHKKQGVLVKRVKDQPTVILTDAPYPYKAIVLAIGPKVTEVKPGDVVILPGIASQIPDWELRDEILVQEADIGAILG